MQGRLCESAWKKCWFNGMETQGFPSNTPLAPFQHRASGIYLSTSCWLQGKGPLIAHALQNKAVVSLTVRDGISQKGVASLVHTVIGYCSPLASTHHSYILQHQHYH